MIDQPKLKLGWRAKNVTMFDLAAEVHTVGSPPNETPKWTATPYQLPDGRRGVWWQPYRPIRYRAPDPWHSRARMRLARVHRP